MNYFKNPDCIYPMLREMFDIVRAQKMTLRKLAKKAGIDPECLYRWNRNKLDKRYRMNYSPKLSSVDCCFEALGYKLIAVPKAWAGEELALHDIEDLREFVKRARLSNVNEIPRAA